MEQQLECFGSRHRRVFKMQQWHKHVRLNPNTVARMQLQYKEYLALLAMVMY